MVLRPIYSICLDNISTEYLVLKNHEVSKGPGVKRNELWRIQLQPCRGRSTLVRQNGWTIPPMPNEFGSQSHRICD